MKMSELTISLIKNVTDSHTNQWQEINNFWLNYTGMPKGAAVLVSLANSVDLLYHVLSLLEAGFVPILAAPNLPPLRLLDLQSKLAFHGFIQAAQQIASISYLNYSNVGEQNFYLCSETKPYLRAGEIVLTTSGTSGFSTGCVFDIEALWRNALKHVNAIQLTAADRVLVNLPLYYSYAFVAQSLAALAVGAKLLITGPPFNENFFIPLLQEKQISVISLTPVLARRLLKVGYGLPKSLRAVTIGGDSFIKTEVVDFLRLNPHLECYLTYGLTEAGPRVATLAAHQEPVSKFASVGRVLPGITTHLEPKAEVYELYLKTDTSLKQRLGPTEKPTFHHLYSECWLQTGDCFAIDDDGYLFFQGRCSNFIVMHGEKVNLTAIKQIVLAFPQVISVNTSLSIENNNVLGYELSVLMRDEASAKHQLLIYLKKYLYRYEQPSNIHIEWLSSEELFLHK